LFFKHSVEILTIHKLNTTQKSQQRKTHKNKTTLVQSPLRIISQETSLAYSSALPEHTWVCSRPARGHTVTCETEKTRTFSKGHPYKRQQIGHRYTAQDCSLET